MRVFRESRSKAPVYAICCGALGLLWAATAGGQSAHVGNRCPRLSSADYEEIDARVLLLLKSEGGAEQLPVVVCGGRGAWVEWRDQRIAILGRAPITDEVVDIIEAQLHDAERQFAADPKTAEATAVAAGQPMLAPGSGSPPAPPALTRRADPVALRAADARGGGISVGIETELPSHTIGPAIGPAFDFGASVGPLLVGGREAFRFSISGPRQVSLMDFQGSVAYGAPFNPDALFGAVARFGAEWMVAYPEGNSAQAVVVPVTDLGLRLAHSFGLVGLWVGIDAHIRLAALALHARTPIIANDVGGSLTLGVAFVDWSRK